MASTGIYLHRAGNYFFGDDFELLADAYRGVTLWEPVSAHLRPLVRLWFELLALWPSAPFGHLASLGLHAGVSLIVAWFVRSVGQSPRVAATAGLLFYGSFLANEAVYWISAIGVILCVGFSLLALIADLKGRTWAALGMLVTASLAYELWIVVPFLMLLRRERPLWTRVPPFALLALHAVLYLQVIDRGTSAYGGLSLTDLPVRMSLYIYRLASPLLGFPEVWMALAIVGLVVALLAVREFRFAAALYLLSTGLFAFSSKISSRFYYVPALAMILMLLVLATLGRGPRQLRFLGLAGVCWLALISPVINYLDGVDYARLATMHREIAEGVQPSLDGWQPGDRHEVVTRFGSEAMAGFTRELRGRPKLIFLREGAIAGLVHAEDLVSVSLGPRGLRAEPVRDCRDSRMEIGAGREVAWHCLEVWEASAGEYR
ncbi:hypothetical protein ABI59_06465 [Acidobacteria bacterium Mor1]|nr:hypothetical protein ABI59_06465 [Acidobacteria bacterium Mor1]